VSSLDAQNRYFRKREDLSVFIKDVLQNRP